MTDQRVSNEASTGPQSGGTMQDKAGQAQEVAHHAADRASDVAADAKAQAKEVVQDATQQARQLVGQARRHLDDEAQQRSQQAATALRRVVGNLDALASGRTDSAGPLLGYARQSERSLNRLADRLEEGPSAVLDDVRRFARRQPVVFLAAAGTLGFVVGRLVRGAREASSDGDTSSMGYGVSAGQPVLPPPMVVADAPATIATPSVPPQGLAP